MSTPTDRAVPATHQEDGGLPYGVIAWVAVVTLFCFGLAIVWSTHILNSTLKDIYAKGEPTFATTADGGLLVDQPEIGIVNQRMFILDNRAQEKRTEQQKRLSTYAWDKANHVAHIPIDRAVQLYVEGHAK